MSSPASISTVGLLELLDELGTVARLPGAACAGLPAELFFPERNQRRQLDKARAVCSGCSCRVLCLVWAMRTGQVHGVWGGYSERERRPLRRQAGLVDREVA